MRNRYGRDNPAVSSDSLLDVLSNLVGVLIVLIVLVGLRIKATPAAVFLPMVRDEQQRKRLELRAQFTELQERKNRRDAQLGQISNELCQASEAAASYRARLAELQDRLPELDQYLQTIAVSLKQKDKQLAELQGRYAVLARSVDELSKERPPARPFAIRFPLSKPVNGRELHLELLDRRVAFIDLEALLCEAARVARGMTEELRWRSRLTAQTMPVGPFALEFTLLKEQPPFSEEALYGPGSFRARLVQWQIVPMQPLRGEPVSEAIEAGSRLEQVLHSHPPQRYTVTVWTYPDSFSAFRLLRDHLYERGYSVAARPLPFGIPIAGSIFGTRSFEQ